MAEKQGKPWVMPEWMRPYEDLVSNTGGGYTVEEHMNLGPEDTRNNIILAGMVVSVSSQVTLLQRLHHRGLLKEGADGLQEAQTTPPV